jgi:ubiquinone/menaquinone biosynthesis C-methylase UbiE
MSLTFEQMREWWDGAAKSNAMTAILSGQQQWDEEAFFRSGREELQSHLAFARVTHMALGGELAVDFGCGMGRMTQALAAVYDGVVGLDISGEMIRLAEAHAEKASRAPLIPNDNGQPRPRGTLSFIQVDGVEIPMPDRSADLCFSVIVVQHMPPPHNLRIVEEFFRVSRKLVLVDAPSHTLKPGDPDPTHGIFLLPREQVLQVAAKWGFKLMGLRNFPVTETSHYQYLFVAD